MDTNKKRGRPKLPVAKRVYISMRVSEEEKREINRVIGNNLAIREFLLSYVKKKKIE